MTDQNNQNKPAGSGGFKPKLGLMGLSALLKQEEKAMAEKKAEEARLAKKEPAFEYAPPAQAQDKIRIIFDDSGSMSGQKIIDARDGCVEFMRNCIVNQTAVAVHPMNYGHNQRLETGSVHSGQTNLTNLTTNLPAMSILVKDIEATGGTPLFETLSEAMQAEPKANRYIIFSDGEPNNFYQKDKLINELIKQEIKCDTVLITDYATNENSAPYRLLKEIADRTGGLFLVFDRNKVNFKTAFKYLAPVLRLQLAASTSMQKALQEGKLK